MKKILNEFKEFISRGNVMDMAIGIIIGGAFTSVVSSLVSDIINPFLGLFGGMNFDRLSWNIMGDVTLNYGSFLTTKICPFCISEINIEASRCPHCTSQLDQSERKGEEERSEMAEG